MTEIQDVIVSPVAGFVYVIERVLRLAASILPETLAGTIVLIGILGTLGIVALCIAARRTLEADLRDFEEGLFRHQGTQANAGAAGRRRSGCLSPAPSLAGRGHVGCGDEHGSPSEREIRQERLRRRRLSGLPQMTVIKGGLSP